MYDDESREHRELSTQLKILAAVKENDKLRIDSNGLIRIDSTTHWQGLWRYLQGENRWRTLAATEVVVKRSIAHTRRLASRLRSLPQQHFYHRRAATSSSSSSDEEEGEDEGEKEHHDPRDASIVRCIQNLGAARVGLTSLMRTYHDDAAAVALCEHVIEQIDDFLKETSSR